MSQNHDNLFYQHRNAAFDAVITLIEDHIQSIPPALLLRFDEMSPDVLRQSAEKESWSLFLRGIAHLKSGAPGQQPGSMTEALSRMSLRSSAFATALGVKPPQFEQRYFSVDYTTGEEAALFFCQRVIEAAEGDLFKSKQIIYQKIMTEKPIGAFGQSAKTDDLHLMKKQIAFSFNVLADTYGTSCHDFRSALSGLGIPLPGKI